MQMDITAGKYIPHPVFEMCCSMNGVRCLRHGRRTIHPSIHSEHSGNSFPSFSCPFTRCIFAFNHRPRDPVVRQGKWRNVWMTSPADVITSARMNGGGARAGQQQQHQRVGRCFAGCKGDPWPNYTRASEHYCTLPSSRSDALPSSTTHKPILGGMDYHATTPPL